jgi:hypothetical protein
MPCYTYAWKISDQIETPASETGREARSTACFLRKIDPELLRYLRILSVLVTKIVVDGAGVLLQLIPQFAILVPVDSWMWREVKRGTTQKDSGGHRFPPVHCPSL